MQGIKYSICVTIFFHRKIWLRMGKSATHEREERRKSSFDARKTLPRDVSFFSHVICLLHLGQEGTCTNWGFYLRHPTVLSPARSLNKQIKSCEQGAGNTWFVFRMVSGGKIYSCARCFVRILNVIQRVWKLCYEIDTIVVFVMASYRELVNIKIIWGYRKVACKQITNEDVFNYINLT